MCYEVSNTLNNILYYNYVVCHTPDHHHLVCVSCGRTEEFESEQVLDAGRAAAERTGFQLLESTLNVRALCPSCQRPSVIISA